MDSQDKIYIQLAIKQAHKSVDEGGFPAGAIVVKDGEIIAEGISIGNNLNDPTSHAETAAIRQACKKLKTSDLRGATLYENLTACVMCFSVANWAGISKIISGCKKTPDMVKRGYYEGNTDIEKLNEENNRKIKLVYLPEFEAQSLELIREWEKQNGL